MAYTLNPFTGQLDYYVPPGGSDNQFQFKNGPVFAGSPGLRNASGNLVLVDPNGTLTSDTKSSAQFKFKGTYSCPDWVFFPFPPSSGASEIDMGVFPTNGANFEFYIYAYKLYGSTRVYSLNKIDVSFTDDSSENPYNVNVFFDAPPGGVVDGYRVIVYDDATGYFFDHAFDIPSNGVAGGPEGFEYDGGASKVTITTDIITEPSGLTDLAIRSTGRLMVDTFGTMTDDLITELQVGGSGNMNLFPGNWSGGIQQHLRFGDPYHQLVNVYGDGFIFSSYPGSGDPIYFGQNFDAAFSLPRANGMMVIPDVSNPPVLQTLVGNNILKTDADGVTGFQVISDLRLKGKLTKYQDIITQGNGQPIIIYADDQVNVNGGVSLGSGLINAPVTGTYRISIVANITQNATVSSTLGPFQIQFTDPQDSLTKTSLAANSLSTTANTTGTTISSVLCAHCLAGTAIKLSIGYTSVVTGANGLFYDYHVRIELI